MGKVRDAIGKNKGAIGKEKGTMGKGEIAAVCRNHAVEISRTLTHMAGSVDFMTKGSILDGDQSAYIKVLNHSMDFCRTEIDEIKAALDQWPT